MNNQDNIVDYIQIGQRVRKLRRDKEYTQEQIAELVGASCSFVGHIERGEKILSVETLARLSKALETDMDYIVFGASRGTRVNEELLNELKELLHKHDLI